MDRKRKGGEKERKTARLTYTFQKLCNCLGKQDLHTSPKQPKHIKGSSAFNRNLDGNYFVAFYALIQNLHFFSHTFQLPALV